MMGEPHKSEVQAWQDAVAAWEKVVRIYDSWWYRAMLIFAALLLLLSAILLAISLSMG